MASGGMMYIPSFIEIDSDVRKSLGRDTHTERQTDRHTHTHRARCSHKPTLIFTK
jgi:hypothetical protein